MYEEQMSEEDDIMSQLVSQIEIKPHKPEFIPVKNTKKAKEKHTVERQRPKAIKKNVAY